MRSRKHKIKPKAKSSFNVEEFLETAGIARKIIQYRRGQRIYSQGDPVDGVFYIQNGSVKLSVINSSGKEAVVGILGPQDFFGEGCLAGQHLRVGTASAILATSALHIDKKEMLRVLLKESALSARFMGYLLSRNIRIEEDLIDQLFNSSEKRLARTLLLLARYGMNGRTQAKIPKVTQEVLAEMIGTSRTRVNFFMNKFRKLGFISYNGGLEIKSSLLTVVLHD